MLLSAKSADFPLLSPKKFLTILVANRIVKAESSNRIVDELKI